MRRVDEIIVHHTASNQEVHTWDEIRAWHLARGWSDIGYHFGIVYDGDQWQQLEGRHVKRVGAHTKGRNRHTIGIAVEGNYDLHPLGAEPLMLLALCISGLRERFGNIPVFGHRDFSATACPGRHFPLDELTRVFS